MRDVRRNCPMCGGRVDVGTCATCGYQPTLDDVELWDEDLYDELWREMVGPDGEVDDE